MLLEIIFIITPPFAFITKVICNLLEVFYLILLHNKYMTPTAQDPFGN